MIKSEKAARICIRMLYCVAIFLSVQYTFFEPDLFRAFANISIAFMFYFLLKNTDLLLTRTFDEFGNAMDTAKAKDFFYGTTPLYPAVLLISISYIAIVKYGWPFQ